MERRASRAAGSWIMSQVLKGRVVLQMGKIDIVCLRQAYEQP